MSRTHRLFAYFYDPLMSFAERAALAGFRRQLLSEVHGDIVELGAGTGVNFRYYPAGARVLALEPDAAMLARARKRLNDGPARITLQLAGDERFATLEPQSFEAVIFTLVLCTVPDPAQAIAGARRVLRPNGKLVLMEHVRADGKLGSWQDRLRPAWEYLAAGCQLNRNTEQIVAQAGFDVSSLRTHSVPGGIIRHMLVGQAPIAYA